MFVKIEQGPTTLCYTADQYVFTWCPPQKDNTLAAVSMWRDGKHLIDYGLKEHDAVYIMNSDGKTIDTFRVN